MKITKEWIKAFNTLQKDTNGFDSDKVTDGAYYVFWCGDRLIPAYDIYYQKGRRDHLIIFKSGEDANKSIDTHAKEWKIFFGLGKGVKNER